MPSATAVEQSDRLAFFTAFLFRNVVVAFVQHCRLASRPSSRIPRP